MHSGANQVRLLVWWVVDISTLHVHRLYVQGNLTCLVVRSHSCLAPSCVLCLPSAADQLSSVKLDAQQLSDELDSTLQELEVVCSELCSLAQQPQAWLLCAADQSGYRAMDDHINAQHARCVAAQQHAPLSATRPTLVIYGASADFL